MCGSHKMLPSDRNTDHWATQVEYRTIGGRATLGILAVPWTAYLRPAYNGTLALLHLSLASFLYRVLERPPHLGYGILAHVEKPQRTLLLLIHHALQSPRTPPYPCSLLMSAQKVLLFGVQKHNIVYGFAIVHLSFTVFLNHVWGMNHVISFIKKIR